jgi:hypothetical protein
LRIRTRVLLAVALIGLGLIIAAQVTPGGTVSQTRPAESPVAYTPDIYFLIPATLSISVSTLNGTAYLTVTQLPADLSNVTPVINVSVVQKDIVTFDVPTRGYYSVEFLGGNGVPVAVTYTLSERGQPSDVTYVGTGILIVGMLGMAALFVYGRRGSRIRPREVDDRHSSHGLHHSEFG